MEGFISSFIYIFVSYRAFINFFHLVQQVEFDILGSTFFLLPHVQTWLSTALMKSFILLVPGFLLLFVPKFIGLFSLPSTVPLQLPLGSTLPNLTLSTEGQTLWNYKVGKEIF